VNRTLARPSAIAHEYAEGFRPMLTKLVPVSGLVFLLAAGAAAVGPTSRAQAADLQLRPPSRSVAEATALSDTRKTALARPASASAAASLAAVARVRFSEARAAMARGLQLNAATRQADMATLEARMTTLFDELTVVEQMNQSHLAAAAREARRLADDWYQTGMRTMDPPAAGLTELPLPMVMGSKADAVSAALDLVAEQATASASPPKSASVPKPRNIANEQASLPLTPPGQRQ
jgi:hypothetical protein